MKGREYPVSNNGNALSDGVNSYELKNGIFYVKKNGVVLRSSQLDSVKMGKI